ncbi:S-adenosyl-L-methionine-dependent methyltransferase [Hypoxylon sp. FL1284]|nr:S-adenosyl-L-methionine-dependent methyltransferase [Hypoxylon sp. FL1284]
MATSTVDDLQALCSKLSLQIQALKNVDEDNDLLVRRTATSTARKLLNELIHPEELAADQIITLSEWACIRMYMKWKFFDKIPSEGGISYRELANSIDADEEVISRIGQMLVSTGKLLQPTSGYVAHSRLSPSYKTGDRNGSSFAMHHDDFQPVFASLPSYFDKYGPRLPLGNTKIPLTYAFGADGKSDHWEVLARHGKEHEEQFGFAMQAMINYAWPYTGVYDFSWVEEYASSNSERPLIVDVGASFGHALRANLVKYPGIPPSRCAVEDRAAMIPSIREDHLKDPVMKDVQKVAADLHKEQPVKGALVYLIRRCTHDYDDEDCVNILKILADSLPDDEPRARVLINDQIMTDPPHRWVAAMDIVMLTWASRERSEKQFADLAQRAGLVLVKVHRAEGATMGVVECKKA